MGNWQPIKTAPLGEQILVWESMYGWLLALHDARFGWKIKSSGNFYSDMPDSVVSQLQFWQSLPAPPTT